MVTLAALVVQVALAGSMTMPGARCVSPDPFRTVATARGLTNPGKGANDAVSGIVCPIPSPVASSQVYVRVLDLSNTGSVTCQACLAPDACPPTSSPTKYMGYVTLRLVLPSRTDPALAVMCSLPPALNDTFRSAIVSYSWTAP